MSAQPVSAGDQEQRSLLRALQQRVVESLGRQNLFVLLLLTAIAGCVAYGLSDVVRGLDMFLLWVVGVAAIVSGWLLAQNVKRRHWAVLWAVVLGLTGLLVRVGRLDRYIGRLLWLGGGFVVRGVEHLGRLLLEMETLPPDAGPFIEVLSEFGTSLSILFTRTVTWILSIFHGAPLFDPAAATLVWGFVLWMAAVWAGWMVRRRARPLVAVVPLGVLLGAVLSYTFATTGALLFMMGFVLVLMAVVAHNVRERRWERENVDYSTDLRAELIGGAIAISIGLMVIAVLTPSISVDDVVDFFRELRTPETAETTERVAESLGLEQQPQQGPSEPSEIDRTRSGGLPRRHLIGTGDELRRRVVMTVRTGELPPMPESVMTETAPRHYWRSATYDEYSGRGWYADSTYIESYEPGEPSNVASLETHRPLRQEVQMVQDIGDLIYVTGILATTDQDYKVAWRTSNDPFAATIKAETYRADSYISLVDAEALHGASVVYPPWIVERYLQLPEDIPERVISLARDLTATEPTPYDRAAALESYLRNTYPYTLNVELPPPNQDVVDYFLFDVQKGYCDYYASAMTVLARASGLPARYVIGYAPGTYVPEEAHYVVTEADAHAWVEIYFPGFGWVEFEPTAGRPALERTTEADPIEWPEPQESLRPPEPPPNPLVQRWYLVLLGTLVLFALLYMLWLQLELVWLRSVPFARAARFLYRRLRTWGDRLEVLMYEGDTPYEFAANFAKRVRSMATRQPRPQRGLVALEEIDVLVSAYVKATYAPAASADGDQPLLVQTWHRLRWRLWLVYLWRYRSLYDRIMGSPGPYYGERRRPGEEYAAPGGMPRA
ncbi:MAG: transglutaminaseTgpA domain-containing protein [Anaerolineales bacterium]